ncbi:MAG TPA: RluA family pseudouridine synthase [Pseudomonadales bacterium]|nr:RluA family pseudouridine synthase [Pseudomonadales bacterium]
MTQSKGKRNRVGAAARKRSGTARRTGRKPSAPLPAQTPKAPVETAARASESVGPRLVKVDEEHDGQRIDNLLLRELRGVPRSRIYSMLRRGEVRVDGRRVKPGHRLEGGAEVRLPPVHQRAAASPQAPSAGLASALEAAILHEDDTLLVVNKPSGLAVHGGSGVSTALVESLRVLRPQARFLELAHRIDRDTSGCVLLAKRRSVLRHLHEALRARTASKRYLALVEGDWPAHLERLEAPLERVLAANGERFVRVSAAGKPALSRVRVVERLAGATLLEVAPETGRTHQIRVHLAHAGHAILGDAKYATPEARQAARGRGVTRLCLHAAFIAVPDWREGHEGAMRAFEAPLPDDLERVLDGIRADRESRSR